MATVVATGDVKAATMEVDIPGDSEDVVMPVEVVMPVCVMEKVFVVLPVCVVVKVFVVDVVTVDMVGFNVVDVNGMVVS